MAYLVRGRGRGRGSGRGRGRGRVKGALAYLSAFPSAGHRLCVS